MARANFLFLAADHLLSLCLEPRGSFHLPKRSPFVCKVGTEGAALKNHIVNCRKFIKLPRFARHLLHTEAEVSQLLYEGAQLAHLYIAEECRAVLAKKKTHIRMPDAAFHLNCMRMCARYGLPRRSPFPRLPNISGDQRRFENCWKGDKR